MKKISSKENENLPHCEIYKIIGVFSCLNCQDVGCGHNKNPNKSKKNLRKPKSK